MVVMDVRRRSTLTGAVENSVTVSSSVRRSKVARRVSVRPAIVSPSSPPVRRRTTSPGSPVAYSGGGCWSKAAAAASDEVRRIPKPRGVENDEPRRLVARHLESVDDLGRDEHPGLGADPMHAIFETERELSLEDEHRLGMSCMDVERCSSPTGSGTYLDRAELLDVHEERDARAPLGRRCSHPRGSRPRAGSLDGRVRRAALSFRVLLPRRRVPARGARGARGRARLRGARAHRPRRPLRLARVRARGEGVRGAADHRRRGDARRRLARHLARRVPPRLREPLPVAHCRACGNTTVPGGAGHARPLQPSVSVETVAELSEGLVCLSGCARRRPWRSTTRCAPRGSLGHSAASASSSSSSGRTSAGTRAETPRFAISPSTSESRRSRPETSTPTIRGERCSRTRSSRSAAGPRSRAASRIVAVTARASSGRRRRCWSASPSTVEPPSGASSSRAGSSSTSPRSSATATRTSRRAKRRRSASSPRSARRQWTIGTPVGAGHAGPYDDRRASAWTTS